MSRLYIGTSGWSYRHWKDCFYSGIARKNWLSYYAEQFSSVEVNGTFYRLQNAQTLRKWFEQTPVDFKFAIKANRYLTHNKKLLEPQQSVLIEKDHASALQQKLAVVLWQLPMSLSKDAARLKMFCQALRQWPEVRHAIELRHPSWFDDETGAILTDADIASCISDAGDWPRWDRASSNLVYIRLHGKPQTYASRYSPQQMRHWAERIAQCMDQQKQVHVYFDNDAECAAPLNARELQRLLNGAV
ncbi:DUF72 domain-containing protein [Methylomarinum sp. Ch1-1]|uniref:DUF72 domain-containing protein n=1 Tax=Methylomarinum roseum TaxID=3067653 RepID=A0AAU7NX09_9GAMM|nr:DUF72 domain-containing protein [Methylomarinum sp. Ch1-1]MDP4522396.1 DUF72 domain-containing protein [Methylomarinum sp. Ch1-1]